MPRVQKDIRQEIASLRHNQYFLALMVLLFVSIIVWTSVSIFTSQKATKVSPKLLQLAKPLTPTIKTEVITELESKRAYTTEELAQFPIYKIIVSQDGKNSKVVPIDTPQDEIDQFQTVKRTSRATPTPDPAFPTPFAPLTASGSATIPTQTNGSQPATF